MPNNTIEQNAIEQELMHFIEERLVTGESQVSITPGTDLFDGGVLDSLKLAMLVNFIRQRWNVGVPYQSMERSNFHDVHAIATMVESLEHVV